MGTAPVEDMAAPASDADLTTALRERAAQMSPKSAADLKAVLRQHRERLSGQSAGLLWLVWGLGLGLATFAATQPGVAGTGRDALETQHLVSFVSMVLVLAVAGVASRLIWSAHALRQDHPVRWWPLAIVAVVAFAGATALVLAVPVAWKAFAGHAMTHYEPALLWAAAGAATLTFAQRGHVPVWPGTLAVVGLAVATLVLALVPASESEATAFALLAPVVALLAFTGAGLAVARTPA